MLLFRAGAHLCAIPIAEVAEIMRPLPLERLAAQPDFLLGLSVIRGASVPVVDAGALLGGVAAPHPLCRFLRLRIGARSVALAVDAVVGVRSLTARALGALPPLLGEAGRELIAALGAADGEFLLVLQTGRLAASIPDAPADA
jgi:purine-binding chemotaxis protein CheW